MNIRKSEYPKTVDGTMTFSEDSVLELPEMEISYNMSINSKGDRVVNRVTSRFPSRYTSKIVSVKFKQSKSDVEYSSDGRLYSFILDSIESFVDKKEEVALGFNDVEKYAIEKKDVELMIFIQISSAVWAALEDSLPMYDLCGNLIKNIIESNDLGFDEP